MSGKTSDIEQFVTDTLAHGPIDQDELVRRFRLISSEQLTWLGIAVNKLEDSGQIRFPKCSCRSHEGDCVLELTS
jgi:hypothetical protein